MSEAEVSRAVRSDVQKATGWAVVLGFLTVFFGVLALGSPFVAGVAVVGAVGFLMLAGGILRVVFAFKSQSLPTGVMAVIIGILTVLCGLLMLGRPLLGLASLTLFLAVYFFVEGVSEIAHAFQIKPRQGWGWVLVGGIAALLLGIMIWRQWPLSGVWAIGTLFGIHLLFSGSSMVGVAGALRQAARDANAAVA